VGQKGGADNREETQKTSSCKSTISFLIPFGCLVHHTRVFHVQPTAVRDLGGDWPEPTINQRCKHLCSPDLSGLPAFGRPQKAADYVVKHARLLSCYFRTPSPSSFNKPRFCCPRPYSSSRRYQ
ncbi:unnamed protein product, partial [Ectocarpus sp. 8 AP-2014]